VLKNFILIIISHEPDAVNVKLNFWWHDDKVFSVSY